MDAILKDLRYAIRTLLKRPGFTLVAVLTLGLGIGANTAIFTLVNAVIFKPLPVANPQELVLFDDSPSEGTSNGDPPSGQVKLFSYSGYKYFREHDQSYQSLAAFRSGEARLSVRRSGSESGESAQRAQGHLVAGNYFSTLGVNPLLGRVLAQSDDQPAAHAAVVMSYGQWKDQWKSDPNVVNQDVILNGATYTVVGIMPPDFFGVRVRRSPDFWIPLVFQPQIELRQSYLNADEYYWLNFVGRLKPGVTLTQAQANGKCRQRHAVEAFTTRLDQPA